MSSDLAVANRKPRRKPRPDLVLIGEAGVPSHAVHERQILDHLAGLEPVTQRKLASELGIALGLTNLLIRRLVKKGWVRMKKVSPRRIRYVITPSGFTAQARLTREYFLISVDFYVQSRERVRERLRLLAEETAVIGGDPAPVVFFGVGDVAEVVYVCLQDSELQLAGVVDLQSTRPFFNHAVEPPSALREQTLGGRPFSKLIVMPRQDETEIRRALDAAAVPGDSVFWI